ncbi:LysM peptidoglycan-binding domain-containing protein [Bdellovibrio sp.]|uniref:LysM peptidoglycan-binding domain-containing protein n=1 Tax=Bdellovibrio sp. TaxID=28201 RepID=UPI0039E23E2B
MNKKFSVMLALIFCALLAQAQDVPPDSNWESDPLDVLEPQKQEVVEPTVPEFTEIPEPGKEVVKPAPKLTEPALLEPTPVAPPTVPTESAATATTYGGDDPDYSKESEFHRIYKTYNEEPTPVEAWEKAAGTRQSEVYQVQKGDTLSGISGTFFGDPFFWPKVWSLNQGQIQNPHEIEPGLSVQFFPGSMEEAPTLAVAPQEEKTEKAEGKKTVDVPVGTLPQAKKRTPLLKSLPQSLPQYRMGAVPKSGMEIQIGVAKTRFPVALEYLEYYISDAKMQGVGVVTATEMNMKTAGDYQYIYVRLDGPAGKEFVAQKNVSEIQDPLHEKRKGHMVEIQGEIEIIEPVNDQKNVYRAIVKKAIQPVEVGSILTPGKLPMIDPSIGTLSSGVGAKIMGGQFDKKRSLFGSNSLVFLDAGVNQGLQEGQSLPIFADERNRNKKSEAVINDRVIGSVKIVRASLNFATGYVTKATDDILLGDYVGKSVVHAFREQPAASKVEAPAEDFEKDFESAPAEAPAPDSGSDDSDLDL